MADKNPFLASPFDAIINPKDEIEAAPPPTPTPAAPAPLEAADAAVAPSPTVKAPSGSIAPPQAMRPLFEATASHFNVPVNVLMALSAQESGHNPLAVNKESGARGVAQYMDATAKSLGINPDDPNEAIPAMAKQLRERLDKGYSMDDAVKEHFAGPDRKLWGEKTAAYGREVLDKAGRLAAELYGDAGTEDASQATASGAPAGKVNANKFATSMSRADYIATLKATNPDASPELLKTAMDQFDTAEANRLKAGASRVQDKFAQMASPEATFNAKLAKKLGNGAKGIEPALPSMAQAPLSEDAVGKATVERPGVFKQSAGDLGRGIDNLKALGYGIAGLVADKNGNDEAANDYLNHYVAIQNDIAKNNPAVIGTYKNINSMGDAGRYAVEAVAENLPMLLPSMLSGGIGALAARKAATGLVVGMVESQVVKGVAREVAEKNAAQFVARAIMTGSAVGAAPSSIGMEAGSIMGDIYRDTGKKESTKALAYGIPAGLLDTLEPVLALRKIAGPVANEVAGSIFKRLGVEGGKQFIVEAGTEGLQTILEEAAKASASGKKLFTPELADNVIDSMLKGGIGGGMIGMGSGGIHEARGALANRGGTPAEREIAAEIDRQTRQVNFTGIDEAARVAMDPNNEAVDPRQTVKPPGAEQSAPVDSPIPAQAGMPAPAVPPANPQTTPQAFTANDHGFSGQIMGDDGQMHAIDSNVGVIEPPAGPIEAAVLAGAAQHAADPAPPVKVPELALEQAGPPPLEGLSMDELKARIAAVNQAARDQGGATSATMDERRRIEKQIKVLADHAQATSKPADEPISMGPFDDRNAANKAMMRAAEATAVPHEVVEKAGKFTIKPIEGESDVQSGRSGSIDDGGRGSSDADRAGGVDGKRSASDGPVSVERPADAGRSGKPNAVDPAGAGAPAVVADPLTDPHAKKSFGNESLARDYIRDNKLAKTHRVDQIGRAKFAVVPKESAPKADWRAAEAKKSAKLEDQIKTANENAAKRAAAKVSAQPTPDAPAPLAATNAKAAARSSAITIDANKRSLRELLDAGKGVVIATQGDGSVKVGSSLDANTHVPIDLTKEERKAFNQAESDLELADTQVERIAAKAAVQAAIRPAIERAIYSATEPSGPVANHDKGLHLTSDIADIQAETGAHAPLAAVAGKPIDKEWTAFAKKSGTLNIDRADMPQVKAEHRGALVNFLNARGVAHEQTEVPASSLKPTQREFSPAKVDKARNYEGGDRSILVSSDNHVLDGHHQWLAKLDADAQVKVIKLDAQIRDLLEQVKEFPSAEVADGATATKSEPAPAVSAAEQRRQKAAAELTDQPSNVLRTVANTHARAYMRDVAAEILQAREADTASKRSAAMKQRMKRDARIDPDSDHMLQAIAKMGGINRESASGRMRFAPEEMNVKANVGNLARHVFVKNGGMRVDQAGEAMADLGYVSRDEHGKHDQSEWEDLLSRAAGGEEVHTPTGMIAKAEAQRAMEMEELHVKSQAEFEEIEHHADELLAWADEHHIAIPEDATLYHDENGEPLITKDEIDDYFNDHAAQDAGSQDQANTEKAARSGAETGDDAGFLKSQSREELAQKDARAKDQNVADKEIADAQVGAFSLSAPPGSVTGEASAMSNSRQESMFDGEYGVDFFDLSDERTIEVDGVRRPIRNSKGELVAQDFAGQSAFWKWFGSSATVDEKGRPVVSYHGTDAQFDTFDAARPPSPQSGNDGYYGKGFYTALNPSQAQGFGSNVMPLYARIEKPFRIDGFDPQGVARSMLAFDGLTKAQRDTLTKFADGAMEDEVSLTIDMFTHLFHEGESMADGSRPDHGAQLTAMLKKNGFDGVMATNTDAEESSEFVAFDASQIKSASANNGKFSPADANITRDIAIDLMRDNAAPARSAAPTSARGAEAVAAQLRAARQSGKLNKATVDFALWALDKSPSLAEGLRLSIQPSSERGTAGSYKSAERVMTLFADAANSGTAVHEILHHSERMMPRAIQEEIRAAWQRDFDAARAGADEKTRAALDDMRKMGSDPEALRRTLAAFKDGTLEYGAHYQLSNPSEYWAVNATRILAGRHGAHTWQAKAARWLAEMAQKVKGWLGLKSDAPILKALDSVLAGDGSYQSPRMLVEGATNDLTENQTDTPTFKRWFGDSKVVDKDDKPLVMYHGTNSDITSFGNKGNGTNGAEFGGGVYVTNAPKYAEIFGNTVMPMYVRAEKILDEKDIPAGIFGGKAREWAIAHGYDAIRSRKGKFGDVDAFQIVAFSADQVKSATGNNGNFDPTDASILHDIPNEGEQAASLKPADPGLLRRFQAQVQDNLNRVKQIQDHIGKVAGVADLAGADHYGAEANRPGRIAARLEDGRTNLTGPLMKRLAKSGHTIEQLGELLHAMHAKERNEAVAKINPLHDPASPTYTGTQGSGMNDDEAERILDKYRRNGALHALADEARDIARSTLDLKLAYGLITAAQHEQLAISYDNYVPLKGDGEYGPKQKRAMGHTSREEFVMQNIARDYDLAVVAGEKNLARQSLLQLVMQFPDDQLWTARVPPKGRYVAGTTFNVTRNGQTEATFGSQAEVTAFMEMLGSAAGQYEVITSAGERVVEFTKQLQDNEVMLFVRGSPVRLQIHDEALAKQLRPLRPEGMQAVVNMARTHNRWLSMVYTGYNPAFILKNFARDTMTGTINMAGNEGAAVAARAWANYPQAWAAMLTFARTGKAPQGVTGEYLTAYRMNGGKVGASHMGDLEAHQATLGRMFDDAKGAIGYAKDGRVVKAALLGARKSIGALAHVVEVANQAFENALRLALFIALRQNGQNAAKAAQAAKQVTVNFDRKGAATGYLGAAYLFINPAIQGTANLTKTLVKGDHKGQAWGLIGAVMMAGAYAAMRGIDDDKDRWLGEKWETRTKNFRLHAGNHTVNIPLSQEYAPFYAAGVAMGEVKRGESPMRSTMRVMSSFFDAYYPINGAFNEDSDNHAKDAMLAHVPTVLKFPAQVAFNQSSFGGKVLPETDFTKGRPDNLKMYRGTKNSVYDKAAQWLADKGEKIGLGNKYENDLSKVSPETLKLAWRTYTGGLGAFTADAVGSAMMAAENTAQLETTDIPFIKDFIKTDSAGPLAGRYYDLTRDAQKAIDQFRQARKAGDAAFMRDMTPDQKQAVALGSMIKAVKAQTDNLADEAVDVNADPKLTSPEKRARLKAIDAKKEAIYRRAIDALTAKQ